MYLNKMLVIGLILIGFMHQAQAIPPFQILRTCMDLKPYDDKTSINMLEGEGMAEKSLDGCSDQYDRLYDGHAFGTLTCDNKFYLIVNDKKVDPKFANNMSINPEIKPGYIIQRSLWYKIDRDKESYLCIYAPLSEQGVGSSYNQYYVIEKAFDVQSTPEAYFYFFDKDVVPITSKTL